MEDDAQDHLLTNMPNVLDMGLDDIELEPMAPEIALMFQAMDKPRTNLGNSGPPGRVD